MKNSLLIVMMAVFIAACGGGAASGNKKAELEKLKKQQAEIEGKISKLEEEISKTDTTFMQEKKTEVTTMALTPQIFKSYIEIQGRVDADENVSLSTEMPGTVTKINVKVGEHVGRGQVLAETDVRPTLQQIADLQTNLDLAKQVYDKQKGLWDQKIGTEVQYLQTKNNKESLENKINAMNEQVRMSKIISPIDGTVDLVNLKLGQVAQPGMGVINVVNFSNLKVKADVAEAYSAKVKNGNEVLIVFPDMKDSVKSTVHYASRSINSLSRTFPVEVILDNSKEYHPNTVAKLKINDYQSSAPELVLPIKYIQKGAEESFVMVDENGVAVKKSVKLGREYSGMAEVISGLKEGDQLITEGYDLVNEGDKITAVKQ